MLVWMITAISSVDNVCAVMTVWRVRGKIVRTFLCWTVYDRCAQWYCMLTRCVQLYSWFTLWLSLLMFSCVFTFKSRNISNKMKMWRQASGPAKWKLPHTVAATSPVGGVWSSLMSMSVSLSACMFTRISLKPHSRTSPNFYACWLWQHAVFDAVGWASGKASGL